MNWSIIPELRNALETIPGRAGAIDFGGEFGARELELTCVVEPQGTLDGLLAQARSIAEWLNPYKEAAQLIFDEEADRYYLARVQSAIDLEVLVTAGRFTIPFICPSPYAYALTDDVFQYTTVGSVQFSRVGTAISQPLIEVRGSIGSGDAIKLVFNGTDVVRILPPLTTGEKFVLDVEKVTAYIEDLNTHVTTNGLPNLDELVFPELNPGLNTVDISVEGAATFTQLDIQCRSRWL